MEIYLHIKSIQPCYASLNSTNLGIISQKPKSLKVKDVESFILSITPINESELIYPNFSVKINYELNKLFSNCEFIKIIPYYKNNYEIIIDYFSILPIGNFKKVFDKEILNNEIIVTNNGKSNISVYNNGILKYATTIVQCQNFKVISQNKYILIQCSNGNINKLIVLDSTYKEIYNDYMELVEFTKNEIKILKNVCDIGKHGIIYYINYLNGEIKKEYVYLSKKTIVNKNQLVPYAFLEAVKIHNFALANTYLSENLQNKINDSNCDQFFGTIKDIYFNPYYINGNTFNYTILGNNYNSFNFTINNLKIMDVEELGF